MRATRPALLALSILLVAGASSQAAYVNFESSHVHPIAVTPDGARLLAVNTPDALLEVFTIDGTGKPVPAASIPVGLEPVTVVARTATEAWVVNQLSDTVSIVDLNLGTTIRTLSVGNEPTDVAFAAGKAFVAVSHEDAGCAHTLVFAPQPLPSFALDETKIRDDVGQITDGDYFQKLQAQARALRAQRTK